MVRRNKPIPPTPLIELPELTDDIDAPLNLTPYQPGDELFFSPPSGVPYSIIIEAIEGTNVTFRNSIPESMKMTLELSKAQEILESQARIR